MRYEFVLADGVYLWTPGHRKSNCDTDYFLLLHRLLWTFSNGLLLSLLLFYYYEIIWVEPVQILSLYIYCMYNILADIVGSEYSPIPYTSLS